MARAQPAVPKGRLSKKQADSAQPSRTERYLKLIIVGGLLAGLLLSAKLWFGDRLYPHTPVFPFLGSMPGAVEAAFYAALLAVLIAIAIVSRPAKWIALFALLAIVMILFDQSRLQPWLYQYLIMLIAVALTDERHPGLNPARDPCRLAVVCVYLWSGLQKVHPDFMTRGFASLIAPFTRSLPHSMAVVMDSFGYIAPFIEIGIAIGLLTRRFRRYAVFAAIGMHVFILVAIGPLGLNFDSVVWPWNIAMVFFLLILFLPGPNLSAREIIWPRGARYQKLVLLLFGFAPALSFFGLWDEYLSFALYADSRTVPILQIPNALADRLPRGILKYVYVSNKPGRLNALSMAEWSLDELNVPIYPESRIYRSVARSICTYAREPSEVKLTIRRKRVLFSPDTQVSYDCSALSR